MSNGKARVMEDAKGRRATYEEITIGQSLGEMDWAITDDLIDLQCQLDQDFDPLFFPSAGQPRIAPPQITYRPPRWLISRAYNVRGLFVGWEMESLGEIRVGMTLKVSGAIVDKYIRKEREYIVYEAVGRDEQGNVLFRTRRTHVLDFVERTAPRSGAGIDSGIKPEKI